jgi:hypothetical protein
MTGSVGWVAEVCRDRVERLSCLLEDCVIGMAHLEHSSVWLDGDPCWRVRVTQAALKDLCVMSDHRATLVALDTVDHRVNQKKKADRMTMSAMTGSIIFLTVL